MGVEAFELLELLFEQGLLGRPELCQDRSHGLHAKGLVDSDGEGHGAVPDTVPKAVVHAREDERSDVVLSPRVLGCGQRVGLVVQVLVDVAIATAPREVLEQEVYRVEDAEVHLRPFAALAGLAKPRSQLREHGAKAQQTAALGGEEHTLPSALVQAQVRVAQPVDEVLREHGERIDDLVLWHGALSCTCEGVSEELEGC
mmetsp:Transcript_43057/g.119804  ORF Transcript_43057/g.119804 Transcript_43057/m.119804 type:complete len:200 (-) Transcript_43057:59-658(-)